MRGSMKRKRSRGAAGTDSGMKVENRSLRIRVPAELDHHSAAQICAQADELVRTQDIREIVFDFSRTVFCDSSGVGMLMGRYKMMKQGEIQQVTDDGIAVLGTGRLSRGQISNTHNTIKERIKFQYIKMHGKC